MGAHCLCPNLRPDWRRALAHLRAAACAREACAPLRDGLIGTKTSGTRPQACTHARIDACTHARTPASPHARTPARPHARTLARTLARTHATAQTCMPVRTGDDPAWTYAQMRPRRGARGGFARHRAPAGTAAPVSHAPLPAASLAVSARRRTQEGRGAALPPATPGCGARGRRPRRPWLRGSEPGTSAAPGARDNRRHAPFSRPTIEKAAAAGCGCEAGAGHSPH